MILKVAANLLRTPNMKLMNVSAMQRNARRKEWQESKDSLERDRKAMLKNDWSWHGGGKLEGDDLMAIPYNVQAAALA